MDTKTAAAATRGRLRWVKEWVPQDLIVAGASCLLYKWVREDRLAASKEKHKEETTEKAVKPEKTTEIIFVCSYEGCGKSFIDVGALKKHSNVHGVRQHVCQYGCGKRFLDSSKLKRHHLTHTGVKDYVCPIEGCGKAFNLDFNLKAHMKTHSNDNYHFCSYPGCTRKFTQECKLKSHLKSHYEKGPRMSATTPQGDTPPKTSARPEQAPSADRPYACPYEGCGKAYIHEYKLNLHLRKEHPGHNQEGSNQAAVAKGSGSKSLKRKKHNTVQKMPHAKKLPKPEAYDFPSSAVNVDEQYLRRKGMYEEDEQYLRRKDIYEDHEHFLRRKDLYEDEDSEETEEDGGGDDEETEDED